MRGFKRVGPSSPPVNNTQTKTPAPQGKTAQNSARSSPDTGASNPAPRASSPAPGAPPPADSETNHQAEHDREPRRTMYCHYFSNFGKCMFEERTGYTCKLEHKAAPVCQNGMACQRSKCMFTHPNVGGVSMRRNPFLDQNKSLNQNFNPWQMQMMNPWMNSNQFQNPWNGETNRN
jgi:hypothetical protein